MSGPPRQLGKYEIIARIGEGGMAEVHLARQRGPMQFEKLVVVKTVHSKLTSRPAVARALLDEARIAALVKHPNVVDIYDLGEQNGTYFIAMEYLEGESLSAVLRAQRTGPRLDPFSTAHIVAECAAGLHAAHELRNLKGDAMELVHQDVAPGNVIVLYSGQVKLVDFGVAKVRSSGDAGLVKGKAGYLAPELFTGAPADRRSDIFALGVVLWESLTLRRLFAARTEAETFQRIRAGVVAPPSRLNPQVTRDLDEVCLHALAPDPAARYQSARAMGDDLIAVLRAANWAGGNQPIARFMRTAFAVQIDARRELLRELAASEVPRSEVLGRLSSVSDGDDSAPSDGDGGEVEIVIGSHGTGRIKAVTLTPELAAAELAPIEPPPPPPPSRARTAAAIALILGVGGAAAAAVVVAQRGRSHGSDQVVIADPGDAAGPAAAIDAGALAPDADEEIEMIDEIDAGVDAADDDREHHHRHHDRDEPDRGSHRDDGSGSGSGSGSSAGSGSGSGAGAGSDSERMPTTVAGLYKDGLKRYVSGDTAGAIKRFQAALARDPGYAPAHRGLGMAYERLRDRAKAARAFRRYLELAPDASDADKIRARLEKL